MRTLGLAAVATLAGFLLVACNMSDSRVTTGSAGEAYDEIPEITTLYVKPVSLPDEIHGDITDEEREGFQDDWPMRGARLIAKGVTEETPEHVVGIATQDTPDVDYYLELEITYLDVGDREMRAANVLDGDEEGWSHVLATGVIYNADTGEQVVELKFDESSGWDFDVPFENDMKLIGEELGRWIDERR